jgi:hypothetical protein
MVTGTMNFGHDQVDYLISIKRLRLGVKRINDRLWIARSYS